MDAAEKLQQCLNAYVEYLKGHFERETLSDYKSTVYIAGPMTGIEQYNYPAFYAAEERLIKEGYHVLNPARLGVIEGFKDWRDYWRINETMLRGADVIYMLDGWEKSPGAVNEYRWAMEHKLSLMFEEGIVVDNSVDIEWLSRGDKYSDLRIVLGDVLKMHGVIHSNDDVLYMYSPNTSSELRSLVFKCRTQDSRELTIRVYSDRCCMDQPGPIPNTFGSVTASSTLEKAVLDSLREYCRTGCTPER